MRAALLLALLWVTGCGPEVEGVCRNLDDCNDDSVERCTEHGHELEDKAERKDCKPAFDEYLRCVDEAGCRWETQCDGPRSTLDDCLGGFPGP